MTAMKRQRVKDIALDLLFDLVGSVFYAVGIYTFAKMANFAPGGLSGLALIMNYLWGLPIGIMTLAFNIPFVILSYKIVGKRFLFKTARTMVFCTIFLDLVFPHIEMYSGSPLLGGHLFRAFLRCGACAFLYARLFFRRDGFFNDFREGAQAACVHRVCHNGG